VDKKQKSKNVSRKGMSLKNVFEELVAIRTEMIDEVANRRKRLDKIHVKNRKSAENLLHYLVLRRHDHRQLQMRLATLGLSSLGRAESYVLNTVDAVLKILHRLTGRARKPPKEGEVAVSFTSGAKLLDENTERLLGKTVHGRGVRIMVTMPSEAANDYDLIYNLLQQGMDCMRINCAHDDAAAWMRMIEHLRNAEHALGCSCRIVMDLSGPKLRTGPLERCPAILRVRPRRDAYGRVIAPARIWFTDAAAPSAPPSPADACLPVPPTWFSGLQAGQKVTLTDARGARRTILIVDVTAQGCWGEVNKTAYIIPGTVFQSNAETEGGQYSETLAGELATKENELLLHPGDLLFLTRDQNPGRPATYDSNGELLTPAILGVTIPEVLDDVRLGEAIWFDDGKIGGIIDKIEETHVRVRITHARLKGEKLRSDKGINLPDSTLRLSALTDKDIEDLSFVSQHADVVELSFANTAHDVVLLQQHLERLGSRRPAIVLKIETRRGFENLPDMLLTAMQARCCGVMIARGDLAVECGFERLAEVQEEILWVCEAAHVPVIWATQVLESLAKDGMPSRAEVTDAAMGNRAECVMLNKGPQVVTAVRFLDGILRRMQSHQTKKRAMLRELHLAHMLLDEPEDPSGCKPCGTPTT
jgi:pyruvate kinase